MNKKAYTLIELLAVIVILSIVSLIAYPKVLDVIGASRLSAYNSAKGNIIKSAKLKYLADVNDIKIVEYTVDDLIETGYLSKNTKNPLTNKDYENTKVLITKQDKKITYDYVEGNTLYDIVETLDESNNIYKENDRYLYQGNEAKNYIYFNKEIYRIIKIDSYRNVYLLKDETIEDISKDSLDNYINSYYNDNYSEKVKTNIISIDILSYEDYLNSYKDNDTYIQNNNNIFVKDNNEYKVLSYLNNNLIGDTKAHVRFVLKLKSSTIIESGNGTQINPYIINE